VLFGHGCLLDCGWCVIFFHHTLEGQRNRCENLPLCGVPRKKDQEDREQGKDGQKQGLSESGQAQTWSVRRVDIVDFLYHIISAVHVHALLPLSPTAA